MVSLNIIIDELKNRLADNTDGLSVEELKDIFNMLLDGININDERIFMRFNYWMNHVDMDTKIVCSNIELVRFGVLKERPPQINKNLGESNPLSLPYVKDLNNNTMKKRDIVAVSNIKEYDNKLYSNILPHLSNFALAKLKIRNNKYVYNGRINCRRYPRNEFIHDDDSCASMNQREYALANIYKIITNHDINNYIDHLREQGIINPDIEFE